MPVKFKSDIPSMDELKRKLRENTGIYIAIFTLLGTLSILISCWNIYRGFQSTYWPVSEGKVLSFSITSSPNTKTSGNELRIEYEYRVEGKLYHAKRVSFTKEFGFTREAMFDYAHQHYPIKSRIPVSYNPNDPSDAVLEPGVTWHVFMWFFAGIFILGIRYLIKRKF